MENKYKSMMNKYTLSDEARERIENALNEKTAHSSVSYKPFRVAVIAACIALLLVGCAVAAVEIFGIPAMIKEQTGEDSSSYQVTAEVRLFKFDEELKALNSSLEKGGIRTSFESKAELEQYLGLMLIDSSILENAGIVETLEKSFESGFDLYPALMKDANARFVVSMLDGERTECTEDPHIITVTSHRVIKNMEFYIEASIFTELFDIEKLDGGLLTDSYKPSSYLITTLTRDENGEIKIATEDCYDALYNFTTAEYEMNNGNKALIVTAEKYIGIDSSFKEYIAYFVQNGVLYSIRPYAIHDPGIDGDYVNGYGLSVLYEVLDSIK